MASLSVLAQKAQKCAPLARIQEEAALLMKNAAGQTSYAEETQASAKLACSLGPSALTGRMTAAVKYVLVVCVAAMPYFHHAKKMSIAALAIA
ncbi:MAG: hypothetical protein QXT25_02465 [Candidatus Anstonellaceae archaeon]